MFGLARAQERLEGTRAGRTLISIAIVGTLACVAIANMPAGQAYQQADATVLPFLTVTGLDQRWEIFAPNPRSEILYLRARVLRADGTVSIWTTPTSNAFFGSYRDSHWRKFVEHAVIPGGDTSGYGWPYLWRTIALYVARVESRHGARPVQVTLIRRWADEIPPGKGPPYVTPFHDTPYYTLHVSPSEDLS